MEKVCFQNSLGQKLYGCLHRGGGANGLGPTVVLCHGMMSCKEGTKQVAFAEALEEIGISVLRFDFSFCGESEGVFEEISFVQEVDDLKCAVDWVKGQGGRPVGLLGSSMGGAVAILYASEDRDVRAVVTLAAVAYPNRLADRMEDLKAKMQEWKEEGFQFGAEGEVGPRFFEEARRQDVPGAIQSVACPVLVLHGALDEVVPVEDARALHAHAGGPKVLRILPEADHRFSRPEDLAEIRKAVSSWFAEHMRS